MDSMASPSILVLIQTSVSLRIAHSIQNVLRVLALDARLLVAVVLHPRHVVRIKEFIKFVRTRQTVVECLAMSTPTLQSIQLVVKRME